MYIQYIFIFIYYIYLIYLIKLFGFLLQFRMADISDEVFYEIEAILNERFVNGRKQYLVKWVGYSDEFNSWEDVESIYYDPLFVTFFE